MTRQSERQSAKAGEEGDGVTMVMCDDDACVRLAGRFFPLRVKREPLLLEHGEETLRVLLFRKM